MLIVGILLGLVLGLLAGGSLANLVVDPAALGLAARRGRHRPVRDRGRCWSPACRSSRRCGCRCSPPSFGILLVGLWANRSYPGLSLAFVGILSNGDRHRRQRRLHADLGAEPDRRRARRPADVATAHPHVSAGPELEADFLLHLGPLGDIIPIPFPLIQNVASIGDVFLTAGLAFFLFASVVRVPSDLDDAGGRRGISSRLGGRSTNGASPASSPAFARVAPPSSGQIVRGQPTRRPGLAGPARTIPVARPEVAERLRRHPYVRLALNGSFSALWVGQLISLFGDRIHQFALAAIVLATTGSAVAAGLSFFFAALPNLFLSPARGHVRRPLGPQGGAGRQRHPAGGRGPADPDRGHRQHPARLPADLRRDLDLDLLPAGPGRDPAAARGRGRARDRQLGAVGRRDHRRRHRLPARRASSSSSSRDALPLAFWLDAATYLASAVLLGTIVVRPAAARDLAAEVAASDPAQLTTGFIAELKAGWHFLRGDRTCSRTRSRRGRADRGRDPAGHDRRSARTRSFGASVGWEGAWGFVEAGLGRRQHHRRVRHRTRRGAGREGPADHRRLRVWGFLTILLALSGDLGWRSGISFGAGIANMVFIIPSQTLFQQRTPSRPDGPRRRLPVRAGVRLDDAGDGRRLAPDRVRLGRDRDRRRSASSTMVAGLAGLFVPAVRDA